MPSFKSLNPASKLHAREAKADSTSRAAKEIIRADGLVQDAKIQRLRTARLAHEAEQSVPAAAVMTPKPIRTRRKRSPARSSP